MERTIDVIVKPDEKYTLSESKLRKFPYFEDLLDNDPNMTQLVLPENEYTAEIAALIGNAFNVDTFDLGTCLKYIRASLYLGRMDTKFTERIEKLMVNDTSILNLLPYIKLIKEVRLMPFFSNLSAKILIKYITAAYPKGNSSRKEETKSMPLSLSTKEAVNLIKEMVSYMTIFKEALIISDIYHFDHNIITANPTIRDIFIGRPLKLGEICQIFEFNSNILSEFTGYFDEFSFEVERASNLSDLKDSDYVLRVVKNEQSKRHVFLIKGSVSPADLPNPFISSMSDSPVIHSSYYE